MKVLFLNWESFANKYMQKAFEKNNIEVVTLDFSQRKEDTRRSEELAERITVAIGENDADMVFSFNYFPVAAIAAYACKVKYVSWTYDSPYVQLYSKTIDLPTNYAFVFDKAEYVNLKKKGADRVFYLPCAADIEYYDSVVISDKEHDLYDADIAMIGSMYTEARHNLMRHFEGLDDYTEGYIKGVMEAQKNIYGMSLLETSLTPKIVSNIQKVCPVQAQGDGIENVEWVIANYFLARRLTATERHEYIDALSEKYKVRLYTPEPTPDLKVENCGTVEYYSDFPKAVKCAKINLIITGIPLRAMDIMGCGGFLLTNYQSDFDDYFVAGQDYVYFDGVRDLIDKAGYYLEHDEERRKIALSGYSKIKEAHTYELRTKQILSIINSESEMR